MILVRVVSGRINVRDVVSLFVCFFCVVVVCNVLKVLPSDLVNLLLVKQILGDKILQQMLIPRLSDRSPGAGGTPVLPLNAQ